MPGPYVVSDPLADQTCTHAGVVTDGGTKVDVALGLDSSGKKIVLVDVGGIATGAHTLVITAVRNDAVWGRQESAPAAPFAFTRPAVPAAPSGLVLKP